ncbi:hypothetical protein TNCV_188791 [Trichonephila clavipes]|nr:hypothetical protein TNCV_188791 [Trichonephila clavipes]
MSSVSSLPPTYLGARERGVSLSHVGDSIQTPKISHSEGLNPAKTAILQHFERGASVTDLLFLCRLHEVAKGKVQYGKQQDITHLFEESSQFL